MSVLSCFKMSVVLGHSSSLGTFGDSDLRACRHAILQLSTTLGIQFRGKLIGLRKTKRFFSISNISQFCTFEITLSIYKGCNAAFFCLRYIFQERTEWLYWLIAVTFIGLTRKRIHHYGVTKGRIEGVWVVSRYSRWYSQGRTLSQNKQ